MLTGFFAKASVLKDDAGKYDGKTVQFQKSGKYTESLKQTPSKITRKKRPKKPKGVKVIVPNVTSLNFQQFCLYSDLLVNDVTTNYSVLVYYSHGKRGPPAGV